MNAVICSCLTEEPVKLLNCRAFLEVEGWVSLGYSMLTARTVATMAKTRKAIFID
jgi:hypothetical protein